jgi:hypothetical protein
MTARYSQPCLVHRNVMSVTHASSGPAAVKSCSSTFGAIGKPCFESVVLRKRRRVVAAKSLSRISLAMRLRPTRSPVAWSSA